MREFSISFLIFIPDQGMLKKPSNSVNVISFFKYEMAIKILKDINAVY